MHAWVSDRYGSASDLELREVPVPEPGPGTVLVKVAAVSVNLSDCEGLRGRPAYSRLGAGLRRPKGRPTLGSDIAGRVVAVGEGVTAFAVGDDVYGDNMGRYGGFAEFAVMPEREVALKPAALTFAQASTIPQAGAIALQSVARRGPGERILINGAGGGSGSFMIQLAVAKGLRVTGVDNSGKLDFMRLLGASDVLDFRQTDFTRTGQYDLVIDLVADRSVFAYRRALVRGGRAYVVGGTARGLLRMATAGSLLGALTGRSLGVLVVRQGPEHFAELSELCLAGVIDIHIDRIFPFAEVPQALTYHGEGLARGKVVVEVGSDHL